MTHQEIKELAGHRAVSPWIMKLVCDAVAKEREECARVCEDSQAPPDWNLVAILWIECKKYLAKAIRARGEA